MEKVKTGQEAATEIAKTGYYRWIVCALLFFATTINYIDRQVIGLLKPTLEAEFNWSELDYGYIIMFFSASYALGYIIFGTVIDKIGSKMGRRSWCPCC